MLAGLGRGLMLALWLAELAWLATRHPDLPRLAAPLLAGYGLVALASVRPGARRLALLLLVPAILLTLLDRRPELLHQGLGQALVYPAFLATILLVRASAAVHPAVERARLRTTALASEARTAGFLAGGHLFGAVLTAGSFALLAPLLDPRAPIEERARLGALALRGSCLAALWSPFFVGMALVTRHLPELPLWQVAATGLGLTGLALAVTLATDGRGAADGLGAALGALAPLLPPVLGAASLIVAASALTGLKSLETVLLLTPPLVGLWLLGRPRGTATAVLARVWADLARLSEEVLLVGVVTVLGRVLAGASWTAMLATPLHAGLVPNGVLMGGLLAAIVLLAVAGLHPLATVAIAMALLTDGPPPVAPLALAGVGLLGWALGTMVGSTSLSLLVARTSFDLPGRSLSPGPNGRFAALFGTAAVATLTLLDALLGRPPR
jgi:hypothetical protein